MLTCHDCHVHLDDTDYREAERLYCPQCWASWQTERFALKFYAEYTLGTLVDAEGGYLAYRERLRNQMMSITIVGCEGLVDRVYSTAKRYH